MERLLLLWDELDDLANACRHLALSAADEVTGLGMPLAAAAASALGSCLLGMLWRAHVLLAGTLPLA
ncbi:MAG TPA: hypothetical protein VMG11_03720 [Steroidobacteraceae bacterium]|nr:hypothetical protein [Steroidobacteraceae bacterium]